MNDSNPFDPPQTQLWASSHLEPRKVSIDPIDLFKRSLALMGEQYWLFVGIALAAVFLGSLVPFGLLFGPMMVGLYMCYADRERGRQVEFGTLFKGFDQFVNTLIAMLIMVGLTLVVMIPLVLIVITVFFFGLQNNGGNGLTASVILVLITCYLIMFLIVFLIQLPFIFTFQLIADRDVTGPQAVSMSFKAIQKNFIGCIFLAFALALASMFASACCFIPAILLMPISFGVLFLTYRDIFGPSGLEGPSRMEIA